jgi:uroporphyrinogen III methyltransferase/synthase
VRGVGLTNPAVIIVGEVVRLREELRWFDNRPLFGKRVLVPRAPHQAETTARAIRERGAEPVVFPVIEITDPPDPARLAEAAASASTYDWVVFTSANGVERFFGRCAPGRDARGFGTARVAVIGPKTRATRGPRHRRRPDGGGIRRRGRTGALARGSVRCVLIRKRWWRGTPCRDAALGGAEWTPSLFHETGSFGRSPQLRAPLSGGGVDAALFTRARRSAPLRSGLTRRSCSRVTIGSIGPITSRAPSSAVPPGVTAEKYTVAGLLDALEAHFAAHPPDLLDLLDLLDLKVR